MLFLVHLIAYTFFIESFIYVFIYCWFCQFQSSIPNSSTYVENGSTSLNHKSFFLFYECAADEQKTVELLFTNILIIRCFKLSKVEYPQSDWEQLNIRNWQKRHTTLCCLFTLYHLCYFDNQSLFFDKLITVITFRLFDQQFKTCSAYNDLKRRKAAVCLNFPDQKPQRINWLLKQFKSIYFLSLSWLFQFEIY